MMHCMYVNSHTMVVLVAATVMSEDVFVACLLLAFCLIHSHWCCFRQWLRFRSLPSHPEATRSEVMPWNMRCVIVRWGKLSLSLVNVSWY